MPGTKVKKKKSEKKKPGLSSPKKQAYRGIIFDIDNVLIDTRASYFEAIRWTIEIYLTHGKVPFFVPSRKSREPLILTKQDVMKFKLLGGFNDDWDCCYGLLIYLLSLQPDGRATDNLREKINFAEFEKTVKTYPLHGSGIVKMLGRPSGVMIEKISRIFQEVYLGTGLFEKIERLRPVFWKKKGLIEKERLIFRRSTLEKLKNLGVKLGIATGRPRFEAIYALDRFGILEFFDAVTTINEVRKAEKEMKQSLRKPHPFSLLQTSNRMRIKDGLLYIGDLPDDMMAAKRAKKNLGLDAVAFASYSLDPRDATEQMKKAGAELILHKPSDITKLVRYPNSFRI